MERTEHLSPLQLISQTLSSLNGATARVAEVILASPRSVARFSITRLADEAGTSASTVTRLAARLGYGGYPELRSAIAEENGRGAQAGWEADIGAMIAPTDSPDQVLNVLASAHARAVRAAVNGLDLATAEALAVAVADAGRIHIFGDWGDAIPAEELHLRLLRIGRPTWFCRGTQEALYTSRLLKPGDVALAVCRGGEVPAAVGFLRAARDQGALTAVITGEPASSIAAVADLVLDTGTRSGVVWTDFFAGRAGDVLTAGLLWVLVAQRTLEGLPIDTDDNIDS